MASPNYPEIGELVLDPLLNEPSTITYVLASDQFFEHEVLTTNHVKPIKLQRASIGDTVQWYIKLDNPKLDISSNQEH